MYVPNLGDHCSVLQLQNTSEWQGPASRLQYNSSKTAASLRSTCAIYTCVVVSTLTLTDSLTSLVHARITYKSATASTR
eukprot:18567-Heterococcus_DN1.PRE.2